MSKPQPPPALPTPASPDKTPEQAKKELQQRQLRISYGYSFSGDHGKRVLADLKARFGWDGEIERPSYIPGMDHARTAHADGLKEPVRHIMAMLVPMDDKPQDKPTTATN